MPELFAACVSSGMGGVDLVRSLRENRLDLLMVLTSSYIHMLAQDDAHGFELLHKPYSAGEFARVRRRTIGGREL
jgi:hypothetical protein